MTGCVTGDSADLLRRLDATVDALVPTVTELLARFGDRREVVVTREELGHAVTVPLRFPDGVGEAWVAGRIFRYRTEVRVDLAIQHNRVIALADGRPTDRTCFLNDFVASATLAADQTELPEKYVAHVVAGIRQALTAVEDHNRRNPQPWSRIRVAAAPALTGADAR